ncbi:3-isopropylmalate dehydrogenase [bioreactor metagenome]|uniref:3-isopropylmalate dehydrogenase n=1 Tax=bioreactor metagenome TaxID=1076179 RepID=A0A645IC69_9ZZZZ
MLRYSFALSAEADAVEAAVDKTLAQGWRTGDMAAPGAPAVGTVRMGELIIGNL